MTDLSKEKWDFFPAAPVVDRAGVSSRRQEAARENGRKSRGPVTAQGKEISSQNAIQHGGYSKRKIITAGPLTEDLEEYEDLRDAVAASLPPPRTALHEMLLEQIVNAIWQIRRVTDWEAAAIGKLGEDAQTSLYKGKGEAAYAVLVSILGANISRLERHQSTQLTKAIEAYHKELERYDTY